MDRNFSIDTLKKYNQEPFHIRHAFTVEGVMRWYANDLGYSDNADFWAKSTKIMDFPPKSLQFPWFIKKNLLSLHRLKLVKIHV